MKHLFFVLLIGLAPCLALAQKDTGSHAKDSATLTAQDTTLAEHGEAGGISGVAEESGGSPASTAWLPLVISFAIGAVAAAIVVRAASSKKKTSAAPAERLAGKLPENPKDTGDSGRLKREITQLQLQLDATLSEKTSLEKNLDIYKSFDSNYYNEAFRKLVAPMNEAMEKGSRKEIMESLMKIMFHFSSLTRYKIAKKQPYDEANIHFLLNQKTGTEAAVTEINKDTPIDKIPKNIKTILDLLKEQESKGLDDSIIAGYRIRNI